MSTWTNDPWMLFLQGGPIMLVVLAAWLVWAAVTFAWWRTPSSRRLALVVLTAVAPCCLGVLWSWWGAHVAWEPIARQQIPEMSTDGTLMYGFMWLDIILTSAGFGALLTLVALFGSAGAVLLRGGAPEARAPKAELPPRAQPD